MDKRRQKPFSMGDDDSVKRRKKEGSSSRKFIPSFEVFWKHVDLDNENVDVSRIFSHSCFEEWLSTRPGKEIQHPEQSYQRVLYAHIRGADNRKPFPERVERELLKRLRNRKQDNPWKQLFSDGKFDVGRRGFRSKGYHESKRANGEIVTDTVSPTMIASASGDSVSESQASNSENFDRRYRSNESGYVAISPQASIDIANKLNNFIPGAINTDSVEAETDGKTLWNVVVETLDRYIAITGRGKAMSRSYELETYSPAALFFLNHKVNPMDDRFKWSFLLPPPEEQHFRDDRPTGTFFFSDANTVKAEDAESIQLFRGSSIGRHLFDMVTSKVSLLYSMIKTLPIMIDTGVVWRREVFNRNDGTNMVLLHRILLTGKESIVTFQDHSDIFQEMLESPLLV